MGVLLVGLALAATVAVVTFRVRRILFRENLDGRVFLGGVESMLARDERAQALKACEAAQGTAVAEVIRAAVEAAPDGREAIERAVDEAQLDWLPERETGKGTLGSLARVCGAAGLLGGAVEVRAAFAQEVSSQALTGMILAIGGGILGLVIALYAKSMVSGTARRIIDETATAARRMVLLLGGGPQREDAVREDPQTSRELSSVSSDSM